MLCELVDQVRPGTRTTLVGVVDANVYRRFAHDDVPCRTIREDLLRSDSQRSDISEQPMNRRWSCAI